jgi:hypothetical protein
MATKSLTVRLEEDIFVRLDRLAEKLTVRAKGAEVNRSDALRVCVLSGLDALEKEIAAEEKRQK